MKNDKAFLMARIALSVSLIGPIFSLVWWIYVAVIFGGPNAGLAVLATPYLGMMVAYPISLISGIVAFLYGEKAKKFGRENGSRTTVASIATIVALLDILPVTVFVGLLLAALFISLVARLFLFNQLGVTCSLNAKYTSSEFVQTSIAYVDNYVGQLPYLNGTQKGIRVSGTLGGRGGIDRGNEAEVVGDPNRDGFVVTLNDGSGDLVGVITDYDNSDGFPYGDNVTAKGFFLYRNDDIQYSHGSPADLSSTTPIIDVRGVCDNHE
jgi:hypothetical protein